jgi:hypothetical protein
MRVHAMHRSVPRRPVKACPRGQTFRAKFAAASCQTSLNFTLNGSIAVPNAWRRRVATPARMNA